MTAKRNEQINNTYYSIITLMLLFFLSLLSLLFDLIFFSYFFEFFAMLLMSREIYLSTPRNTEQRNFWIMASLAGIFWTSCNVIWYIYKHIFEKSYNEYNFLHVLYIIPTMLIVSATAILFINRIKSDTSDKFSVINDSFGIFFMLCIIFIAIFNNQSISVYTLQSLTNKIAIISIFFSFLIIFFTLVVLFANNVINIHISVVYSIVGCGFFGIMHVIYHYNILINNATDNRFITLFYMVAFFSLTLGSYEFRSNNAKIKSKIINFSNALKWVPIVCLIPFVLQNQIDTKVSFFIIVILFGHLIVGYYIKHRSYSDSALKKEQNLLNSIEKDTSKHTNELMLANLKLKDMIERDYLTGLYTGRFTTIKLNQFIKNQKPNHDVVVFNINIKNFRLTNSSYGYKIGDKILKNIAKRISSICNKKYICGRITADQFIIVIKSKHQDKDVYIDFANQIISCIQEPIYIDTYKFMLNCVIGIGVSCTSNKKDAKTLMLNADKAMFFAKEQPSLNPYMYNQEIEKSTTTYSSIHLKLSQSNINDEFEIFFQPVLDIRQDKIVSAEILLRWKDKNNYTLSTNEFITVAEKSDMINRLYDFVINSLAKSIKIFKQEGINIPKISINISPNQSLSTNFIQKLRYVMQEYRINPCCIELEISEKIWTNSEKIIDDIFNAIRSIGINICIDDFGTEHSSILYTKKYRPTSIKTAKSTITDIAQNSEQRAIAQTLADISKSMGITTIAKGAETKESIEILKDIGYDQVQGNIISEAMNIDKFIAFLRQNSDRIQKTECNI